MAEAEQKVKDLTITEPIVEGTAAAAAATKEPAAEGAVAATKEPGKKREPKPKKEKPAQAPKEKKPQQKKKTEVRYTPGNEGNRC